MRSTLHSCSLLLISVVVALVAPSAAHASITPPTYLKTIGGPGHAAMYPSGLEVDSQGNVYVADTGNDQVAAYAPDGHQLWRVGTRGPKTLTEFVDPRDVAYLNGVVYVADTGNGRVIELSASNGAPITAWNGFGSIMGITAGVDSSGHPIILVTEDQKNTVRLFTPSGGFLRTVGSGPGSGNGQLNAPRDAATDSSGAIYVDDFLNNRIAKFSPTGAWILNWGRTGTAAGQFRRPYGVAVDRQNGVYIADSNNGRIQKFTTSGTYLRSWGSQGTGTGQFSQLRRVAVGSGTTPDVYGADLWGYRIERFWQGGAFKQQYGGTPPPLGRFNEPSGVTLSATDIYVSDTVNQRVERFSLTGSFELSWGDRGWGSDLSGLGWARDLTYNPATNTVWVADTKNNRLLQFTTSGAPTGKTLGTGFPSSALGGFYWPLAVTSVGADLIVADTSNNRVQRVTTSTLSIAWTATGFNHPSDVAVADGVVYVADAGNRRIVELNASNGAFIRAFGSTVLHTAMGVAVDLAGNVWVSDTTWNRIVELSPGGSQILAFGGPGTAPGRFNFPTKLEIRSGVLYVVDQWNDRVQVFAITA
jgi:tripartite motif-containing protein 71